MQILYDWQRGRLPFFSLPPGYTEEAPAKHAAPGEIQNPEGLVSAEDVEALEGPNAAKAAEVLNSELVDMMRKQIRQKIPVQQGYYTKADEGEEEEEEAGVEDDDVVSLSGEEDEEEEYGDDADGSDEQEEGVEDSDEEGEEEGLGGAGSESEDDDGYGDLNFDDLVANLERGTGTATRAPDREEEPLAKGTKGTKRAAQAKAPVKAAQTGTVPKTGKAAAAGMKRATPAAPAKMGAAAKANSKGRAGAGDKKRKRS